MPSNYKPVYPDPPDDLSYARAVGDPTLIPFETRKRAAMAMLSEGLIDGWQALSFTLYGLIAADADDEDLATLVSDPPHPN